MENWKEYGVPFENFTKELTQEWITKGFSREECEEWLKKGYNANDANHCSLLRNIKINQSKREEVKESIENYSQKTDELISKVDELKEKIGVAEEEKEKEYSQTDSESDSIDIAYCIQCEKQVEDDKAQFSDIEDDLVFCSEVCRLKWDNNNDARQWLDKKYPKEERSQVEKIYFNKQLEGELDLIDFKWLEAICISSHVDEKKIIIKNQRKEVKVISLNAQTWLDQNYPKDGVCIREAEDDYRRSGDEKWIDSNKGKTRDQITKLDLKSKKIEGSLDLTDFSSLEELHVGDWWGYWRGNKLTHLNLTGCNKLKKLDCSNNKLTELNLSNHPQLKEIRLFK